MHIKAKWLYFMWHFVLFFCFTDISLMILHVRFPDMMCIWLYLTYIYWISSFHLLSKQRMLSYTLPLVILPCCIPKVVMIIKQTFSSLIIWYTHKFSSVRLTVISDDWMHVTKASFRIVYSIIFRLEFAAVTSLHVQLLDQSVKDRLSCCK